MSSPELASRGGPAKAYFRNPAPGRVSRTRPIKYRQLNAGVATLPGNLVIRGLYHERAPEH